MVCSVIIRPNDLNAAGRLFGGMLMQWIDEVAALVAKRHTHTNVTTASVDNLSFLKGAYPGDSVVIIGQLVYVFFFAPQNSQCIFMRI